MEAKCSEGMVGWINEAGACSMDVCWFHIIHGSFVDGYGVRTTIFLKGCPLRCVWCCNPEGQSEYPELKVTESKCNGCGRCVTVCPTDAIQLDPGLAHANLRIDRELCTNCGSCISVCYSGALEWFGKHSTVDEIFEMIRREEVYYRGGGGITIGGGEPTLQPHFVRELLRRCKKHYIGTAIDTCGYTLTDEGFKVLEEADLLLYDLKGMDPRQHLRNTGVSNARILENLRRLDEMGKSIIVRVPIVPGYTDSLEDKKRMAEFLHELKSVERVDLLPYHRYGTIKYDQLGRKYGLSSVESPPQQHIDAIQDLFELHRLRVQIGG